MNSFHWQLLLDAINGNTETPPIGFIIDSPWLPGWFGISTLDYYASENLWFDANVSAIETFPEVMFLPGFWSEYGMATEPSAFGARMVWAEQNLPHAEKVIRQPSDIDTLVSPNVKSDGLLPFVIQRLRLFQERIISLGHEVKFAIARGPLNIASFLMGTSEFLMLLAMEPQRAHALLEKITAFLEAWLRYQKSCFASIDAILVLDDIVGFVGPTDMQEFVVPYVKRLFDSFPAAVRLFHNDAHGLVCAPLLEEMNVNLFNFGFEHSLQEMRQAVGENVALLGNLPPRDVLALGLPDDVKHKTLEMWNSIEDKSRIIWSCGGGMPQNVSTENIRAFVDTIKSQT